MERLVDSLESAGLDVTPIRAETRHPSDSEAPVDHSDTEDIAQARTLTRARCELGVQMTSAPPVVNDLKLWHHPQHLATNVEIKAANLLGHQKNLIIDATPNRVPGLIAAVGIDVVQQHRGPEPGLSCDADIGFAGSSLCGSRSVQPR